MTERWVCSRCFTSNAAELAACPNCGQVRPAVGAAPSAPAEPPAPSAPDRLTGPVAAAPVSPEATPDVPPPSLPPPGEPTPISWGPPAGPTQKPTVGRSRRGMVVGGLIGLVAIGFVAYGFMSLAQRGDEGDITQAGTLHWSDLKAGDCFDVDPEATVIENVDAIPCADSHVYETFFVAAFPDGDYPTEEEQIAHLEAECLPAFETYVDYDFQTSVWFMNWLGPNEDAWDQGERRLVCFLNNSTETPVTGSAQGSAK